MVFSTHSYIAYKLTGDYYLDFHTAHAFGEIFDYKRFKWDQNVLSSYGVNHELLPEVLAPNKIVGGLKKDIAIEYGLKTVFLLLQALGILSPQL